MLSLKSVKTPALRPYTRRNFLCLRPCTQWHKMTHQTQISHMRWVSRGPLFVNSSLQVLTASPCTETHRKRTCALAGG